MYKGYETPEYRVVRQQGDTEIRDYAARTVAEVTVEGDRRSAANRGFRILAGYIFGGNADKEKVAMTTPVTETPAAPSSEGPFGAQGGPWTITFTMPSVHDLETLPPPNDPRIRLRRAPAQRLIVQKFSGVASPGNLTTHVAALLKAAEAMGVTPELGPIYAFYDAPFTLPWNRRNEVAFTVR